MERESFEDEEMAQLLNERFVSIKVDREERPDIDSVYMNICQMMTGHGGWPLSVFLTPDQKPFYAGTYFPKENRYGISGFKEVIINLYAQFKRNRNHIETIAEDAKLALLRVARKSSDELPSANVLHKTYQQLSNGFGSVYGGFNEAPKFPIPHHLMFLLKFYKWNNAESALKMVEKTLDSMANGGIYDHIGYGFARYSTDEMWLVPHFEKMLYDNALLLYAYAEGFQVTKNVRYKEISEQIVTFIGREMKNREGGFYSAIDADSEGVEGKYYVWSKKEVIDMLGEESGDFFCKAYDITEAGNFEGKNIPNLIHTRLADLFSQYSLTQNEGKAKLEACRKKLWKKRNDRVYPHLDDKILTSWNALMIVGLAKASQAFQDHSYFQKAEDAIQFIEKELKQNGKLLARYRDGEAKFAGYLDDYAFLLWAYIEMYEASFSTLYLEKAEELAQQMMELFWDEIDTGFYFTGESSESLIVREKQIYDGAIPSGNSVAAVQLERLGHLTGEKKWMDIANDLLKLFKEEIEDYGVGHTFLLQALLLKEMKMKEVVVLGKESLKIIKKLQQEFIPNVAIIAAKDETDLEKIMNRGYQAIESNLTVYICEDFTCHQPLFSIKEVLNELKIHF
ncbi:thioredoxin domain-containing protein [Cytobacillus sp. Hz8]|uniref:thioredoxin domain-containing protein n=1 Tax=Cytobacillus sp. Hz8 TaxID=3347168 RepID=UPI0035DCE3E3